MFVKNEIQITGESGEEVSQAARDKIAFLKLAGFKVVDINAYGDFSFQGKVPLSFDEDDPQNVVLPIGRKLIRIGQDDGLACVPTASTVVNIVALVEGDEYDGDEDAPNLLDALDAGGRKLAKGDETDEDEDDE